MSASKEKIDPNNLDLVQIRDWIREWKETVLANVVMVGEVPAPTFKESQRTSFVLDRFRECGLSEVTTDEMSNAIGVLPGTKRTQSILVCAHMDTLASATTDHSVRVDGETMEGAGLVDNSLGVASMISLPTLLEQLGLKFQSDIILVGSTRSLGKGNLEGVQYFLDNHVGTIQAGVFVEGAELGRLSSKSVGMLRAEVHVDYGEGPDSSFGAIAPLCDFVAQAQEIPVPHRPRTTITMGRIESGNSFNIAPHAGTLQLEVRSEKLGMVSQIRESLYEIAREVGSSHRASVQIRDIARCRPGGVDFRHPLTVATRSIMERLGVEPVINPSVGELSALIGMGLPGVTIGISNKAPEAEPIEIIKIEPIFTGLAQLVGLLVAIDQGVCDEE